MSAQKKNLINFTSINNGKNGLNPKCKDCRHKVAVSLPVSTKRRDSNLLTKYKISLEDYNKMLQKQNYCCDICGINVADLRRSFDVDHDHKTRRSTRIVV